MRSGLRPAGLAVLIALAATAGAQRPAPPKTPGAVAVAPALANVFLPKTIQTSPISFTGPRRGPVEVPAGAITFFGVKWTPLEIGTAPIFLAGTKANRNEPAGVIVTRPIDFVGTRFAPKVVAADPISFVGTKAR